MSNYLGEGGGYYLFQMSVDTVGCCSGGTLAYY